ncbi:MAG: RNA polymerase ECF-type sigma factor, partial [uncultured Gemmatimonadetes bacterium]
ARFERRGADPAHPERRGGALCHPGGAIPGRSISSCRRHGGRLGRRRRPGAGLAGQGVHPPPHLQRALALRRLGLSHPPQPLPRLAQEPPPAHRGAARRHRHHGRPRGPGRRPGAHGAGPRGGERPRPPPRGPARGLPPEARGGPVLRRDGRAPGDGDQRPEDAGDARARGPSVVAARRGV